MRSKGWTRAARIFLGIYLACIFVPVALVAVWAFTDYWPWPDLLPEAFSLRGLEAVFNEYAPIYQTIGVSVLIAVVVSAVTVTVGTMAARALANHQFVGKSVFHFGTILPFLIPTTVFAMGVQVAFLRMGLGDTVLGVIVAHVIVALPYAMFIMTDVIRAAGTRLEEQARSLGAGPLQVLRHVTIPALMPGLLSAASMSYILSFSQYFITVLIGGGVVQTLAVTMFPFLNAGDRTIAAMYSVVFLVLTLGVFLLFNLILRRCGVQRQADLYS